MSYIEKIIAAIKRLEAWAEEMGPRIVAIEAQIAADLAAAAALAPKVAEVVAVVDPAAAPAAVAAAGAVEAVAATAEKVKTLLTPPAP